MHDYISGIQQIGIGVKNAQGSLKDYASLFGMDTLVFNDISEASLMTRYTGGSTYRRQASLSLNMQGGGGFEIWQFLNREPEMPYAQPKYGDLGIFAPKMKCDDVEKAYESFSARQGISVSNLHTDKKNDHHFWVRDGHENLFNIVKGNHWFQSKNKIVGGVTGAVIGVSDIERSLKFYQTLLNIEDKVYDETFICREGPDGLQQRVRKVLLQKHPTGKGAFGKLLGSVEIELVQTLDRVPSTIFANRFWGDCGFIHLCFDVFDMCGLKKYADARGYKFTVDSIDTFGMENASGRFCYIEDPDGTLIELVETHKVPVVKKLGIHLNLKKRDLKKPLPDWMINLLSLSKVK